MLQPVSLITGLVHFTLGLCVESEPENYVNEGESKGEKKKEKEKLVALFDRWTQALPEAHGLLYLS